MECKDTAYRAISPDGLKGFPLEGKHPKVDPLGSEGNSQGKKKAKDMGKERLGKALKIPCARNFFALRKEANFLPQSDSFPCGKSFPFELKKLPLPLEERPFFCRGGQKRKAPRLTVSALDKELVRREIPSDEAGCEGASPCGKERRS